MDNPNKSDEDCQEWPINTNFNEIFYQSPIGIFFYDKKGKLTNANDSALYIARIPKLEDVLGTNIFDNPKIASKKEELHKNGLIKFQDSLDLIKIKEQNIYNPLESEIIDIDWTVSVTDSGYLIQLQDITEHKKVDEKLRESERQYSELFNSMNEMFQVLELIYDDNGKIVDYYYRDVNPAFEQLTGKTREQIIDKKVKDIFGIVEDYWLEAYDKALKTGKPIDFVNYGAELDKYYDVHIWKIKENQVAVIFNDITEHKKAEEKTKRILGSIAESYVEYDNEWRYVDINNKSEELLGINKDKLINKIVWEVFPKLIDTLQYKELHRAKKENIPVRFETKSLLSDNWYEINAYPHPEGLSVYSHNINKRKKNEKEIEKTMEELIRSNTDLERFAYVSSHDLQEPLRMVTLYSQLLEKRYKDRLDDDADDFIEYIVENAKRMKYLIDDLLEYSRITSQAKEFENIDMDKVLESILSNLSIIIVENNVDVTHDHLPKIFADKNQIMQVFQNLLTNAIKFRGKEPPKIDISAQKKEKEWIFSVQDNGIGINPKHQKQIFEVFKRLHTREEYPGTGIGLSIAQKIIERHGGRIWAESDLGKGSTFYFTIPFKV
jgi:PAS domain S-box-containing protein